MKIEQPLDYTLSLYQLTSGLVYSTIRDNKETYVLKTDEPEKVVQLNNGILWEGSTWIKNAKFREVNAKVVIE